uniref:(northern house mosquito) hypothetical protein n=1 Tax=Culex pipiens TaxID=7175 RepID=A0A8D8P003_CULPI
MSEISTLCTNNKHHVGLTLPEGIRFPFSPLKTAHILPHDRTEIPANEKSKNNQVMEMPSACVCVVWCMPFSYHFRVDNVIRYTYKLTLAHLRVSRFVCAPIFLLPYLAGMENVAVHGGIFREVTLDWSTVKSFLW